MHLLFFVLLLTLKLSGQEYIWPTNASEYLSSSFCEYRSGHFHAAIDIKTWNTEGYPCYAIADGRIERIKISPFGAGKALYIKLNDGRSAVYFHLQKFTKELEEKIRESQIAKERYSIEWWPKDWWVKQGDIIAYSGQTGIGVPHLHFEIRDQQNIPINPLEFYPNVKDNMRPRLKKILLIPQDEKSTVNGSYFPQSFDLTYTKDGLYVIEEPLYVNGRIGLAVNGFDQTDGVSNKLGFYSSRLWVDSIKVFESAYDRVGFKNSHMVDIDIYYPAKVSSGLRFNKLYVDPYNELDFYNRKLGPGIISINKEETSFEIQVSDYFNNTSIIKSNLLRGYPQAVKLAQSGTLNETAYLKLILPEDITNLEFYSGNENNNLKKIDYFEIIERNAVSSGNEVILKLRLSSAGDNIIQSVIHLKNGLTNKTIALLDETNTQQVDSDFVLSGKNLVMTFSNIQDSENLRLHLKQSGTNHTDYLNILNNYSEHIMTARDLYSDSVNVVMQDDKNVYLDTTLVMNVLLPGKSEEFNFFNDSLRISTNVNSVYDTLLIKTEKIKISPEDVEIPVWGSAYKVDAGNEIFNRGIYFALQCDSAFYKDGKAGVYSVNDKGLHYKGGTFQNGYLTVRTKTSSTFTVAADTIAPQVNVKKPSPGKSYTGIPLIVFTAEDEISKIGSDKNIRIEFDGKYIVPEWDPETNQVTGKVHFAVSAGNHQVRIEVKDQAGNMTEKLIPFIVQ